MLAKGINIYTIHLWLDGKLIMDIMQVKDLIIINELPEKGSAVLTYFHERDDVCGGFYIGIVESKGNKRCRLRWWGGECEDITSIEGKNDYYKYYAVLSYISYDEYIAYGNIDLPDSSVKKMCSMSPEPNTLCIRKFNEQQKNIKSIKKEYKPLHKKSISSVKNGQKIKFVHFQGLSDPVVASCFTRIKECDNNIYANCDDDLEATSNEDAYHLIKKSLILEC